MKVEIIAAHGCEEGETLTIVDILRRAEVECDLVGLDSLDITGGHDVTFRCDKVLAETEQDYDMIVLPGGYAGVDAMKQNEKLKETVQKMDAEGKWVAAICAAPLMLDEIGVLRDRTFTCYPTVREKIQAKNYVEEVVVQDGNLITSHAPACAWAFAYYLADVLGADAEAVKKRMVYANAFEEVTK